MDDSSYESYSFDDEEETSVAADQQPTTMVKKNIIPNDKMHQTANVKYDTVIVSARKEFTMRDLYYRAKDNSLKPKHKGEFHFLVGKNLDLEKFNPNHFILVSVPTSKGKDMAKSIRLTHFYSTVTKQLEFSFPTIPALKSEGFGKNCNIVTKKVFPNSLNGVKKLDHEIINRNITYANIAFHNDYPTENAGTVNESVSMHSDFALVKFNSSVVMYHNTDPINKDKIIKGPSESLKQWNLCVMNKTDAEKYLMESKTDMSDKIPHADISRNMEIVLKCVIPSNRVKQHDLFIKTEGKEGKRYDGFADLSDHAGSLSLDAMNAKEMKYDEVLDKKQIIEFRFEMDYLHGDGNPIPFTV